MPVFSLLSAKLNNPKNLVVLEPSNESFQKLLELSKKYNFNAFNGPLVNENENLECKKQVYFLTIMFVNQLIIK